MSMSDFGAVPYSPIPRIKRRDPSELVGIWSGEDQLHRESMWEGWCGIFVEQIDETTRCVWRRLEACRVQADDQAEKKTATVRHPIQGNGRK